MSVHRRSGLQLRYSDGIPNTDHMGRKAFNLRMMRIHCHQIVLDIIDPHHDISSKSLTDLFIAMDIYIPTPCRDVSLLAPSPQKWAGRRRGASSPISTSDGVIRTEIFGFVSLTSC